MVYQKLFDYMLQEHNVLLTEDAAAEIERIIEEKQAEENKPIRTVPCLEFMTPGEAQNMKNLLAIFGNAPKYAVPEKESTRISRFMMNDIKIPDPNKELFDGSKIGFPIEDEPIKSVTGASKPTRSGTQMKKLMLELDEAMMPRHDVKQKYMLGELKMSIFSLQEALGAFKPLYKCTCEDPVDAAQCTLNCENKPEQDNQALEK